MTYFLFLVCVAVGAFVFGALEGQRFGVWLKSWLVKEEQAVVVKVEHEVGVSGPTGPALVVKVEGATGTK